MSWTALALGHQPSDVVVIAAGLTTVITSSVRPLFRWLEFRAFMKVWQEIARRDSDMRWLQYFSYAMAAFRSRGKTVNSGAQPDLRSAEFLAHRESPAIQQDESASLVGLSWHMTHAGNGEACVRVASQGDNIIIGDSKHPNGPVLTYSSVEWKMFVEGIRKGDFDELLGRKCVP
jgi:hypothetical protein